MSSASTPRAVVFDLDGLMFNTEELYQDVGAELLRRRGCEFGADLLDAMMGRPNHVALQIMIDWHDLSATVDELSRETDEIFPAILDARLRAHAGLARFARGARAARHPQGDRHQQPPLVRRGRAVTLCTAAAV